MFEDQDIVLMILEDRAGCWIERDKVKLIIACLRELSDVDALKADKRLYEVIQESAASICSDWEKVLVKGKSKGKS